YATAWTTSSQVLQLQPYDDAQREELVQEELERVRGLYRIDLRRILAHGTPEIPLPIFDREVAAVLVPAHVLDRAVRFVQEAVFDHHRGTVADEAMPLHLAEPEAALAVPSFSRLPPGDL